MDVGMQRSTGFVINRALKRVFLLHKTELLQLVQNKNKVTLAVHQLKMTSLSEARRLLKQLPVGISLPASVRLFSRLFIQ